MICPNCDRKIDDRSESCPYCGYELLNPAIDDDEPAEEQEFDLNDSTSSLDFLSLMNVHFKKLKPTFEQIEFLEKRRKNYSYPKKNPAAIVMIVIGAYLILNSIFLAFRAINVSDLSLYGAKDDIYKAVFWISAIVSLIVGIILLKSGITKNSIYNTSSAMASRIEDYNKGIASIDREIADTRRHIFEYFNKHPEFRNFPVDYFNEFSLDTMTYMLRSHRASSLNGALNLLNQEIYALRTQAAYDPAAYNKLMQFEAQQRILRPNSPNM